MIKRICLLLVFVLALTGCSLAEDKNLKEETSGEETQDSMEPAVKDIFAMDTYMTLTAYGEQAQEAVDAAAEEIERIEALLSTGKEDSEISVINREESGEISEDTKNLIEKSIELYDKTDGLFDITIYPLMKAWGFTDENYRVPKKNELEKLLSNMGTEKISLNQDGKSLSVEENVEIDLGGIAKGYTSERVINIFEEYGVTSGVVSLGGNVQVLGKKTDGSKWRVAVQNPDDENDYVGVILAEDQAVITSGGYERYFEEDGEKYHHIIDPRTGYPAENGLTSVTIVNKDGTMADALSTSLFIMGEEKAVSFWRENSSEFDMVLVNEKGDILVSKGLDGLFESDYEFQIIDVY